MAVWRLCFWWLCWFGVVAGEVLAGMTHTSLKSSIFLAIIGTFSLWPITRGCCRAFVGVCRKDMRGAQRWQHRLGSSTFFSLRVARMRFYFWGWVWWSIVLMGGAAVVQLGVVWERVVFSIGLILALALTTWLRGHAAVDLYRAAAIAAAARRVGAGD